MSNMMSDVIASKAESNKKDRERLAYMAKVLKSKELYEVALRLQALPSWEAEVESVYFYTPGKYAPVDITVTLKKVEAEVESPEGPVTQTLGSNLPREIVKAGLAVKLDKSKHWDGGSLRVRGTLFPARKWRSVKGFTIDIEGYVPQTCRLEWEERVVPSRVERVAKIICGPESDTQAQAAIANDSLLAPITADTADEG